MELGELPLELSWGRLCAEENVGIEVFRTSLKQEFQVQSLLQGVSQMGHSGGRPRGNLGISNSLNCAPCLDFPAPPVVLPLKLHIPESAGFRKGWKHPERKYFGIHLLDKTDPGGFVVSSGAAQVSSALALPKPLEWRAGKGRSGGWGGEFPAELLGNPGMKIPV